jgi:hypothetical protein
MVVVPKGGTQHKRERKRWDKKKKGKNYRVCSIGKQDIMYSQGRLSLFIRNHDSVSLDRFQFENNPNEIKKKKCVNKLHFYSWIGGD